MVFKATLHPGELSKSKSNPKLKKPLQTLLTCFRERRAMTKVMVIGTVLKLLVKNKKMMINLSKNWRKRVID